MSDKLVPEDDTEKTGGAAFPRVEPDNWQRVCYGMTMRDYFAAKALQGLISAGTNSAVSDGTWTFPTLRSRVAYEYADAMLKERAK